jgi:hypothetical protein
MVEDSIDRLPARLDPPDASQALDELKQYLRIRDTWRDTYPDNIEYTFHRNSSPFSQSRIDRIYMTENLAKQSREWSNEKNPFLGGDHDLISVKVSQENDPQIGKGRWTFPNKLLKDEFLSNMIREKTNHTIKEIETMKKEDSRSATNNPQIIWENLKKDLAKNGRKRERAIVPKIQKQIREKKDELNKIKNPIQPQPTYSLPQTDAIIKMAELNAEIQSLEHRQLINRRNQIKRQHQILGEKNSRPWF